MTRCDLIRAVEWRRGSEGKIKFSSWVVGAISLGAFAALFVLSHGKHPLMFLELSLYYCIAVASSELRKDHVAWRALAETATGLGVLGEPECGPLTAYLDIRSELALVRRSRFVYLAVAAAAPFVLGFFAYAGFVDRNFLLWTFGAFILVNYASWLWQERRYRLAVFSRAIEQGLL